MDLFSRIEYFFKRLEEYIEVRPTVAMMDIIVEIMVETLSILGIVTKEIKQGRMSMSFPARSASKVDVSTEKYLQMLVGWTDVKDSLQRLDKLTQEEAYMAAAEALKIARRIDDKVKAVDDKVEGVDDRVKGVDRKVDLFIKGERHLLSQSIKS